MEKISQPKFSPIIEGNTFFGNGMYYSCDDLKTTYCNEHKQELLRDNTFK